MYSLDVIVPFFNEEDFLEESVNNLIKTKVYDHIYLVNNNSTDKSKEIALQLVQNNSNITYLETNNEKGKGVGLKKAIENMHPLPKIGSGEDFSDIGSFLLSNKNICN